LALTKNPIAFEPMGEELGEGRRILDMQTHCASSKLEHIQPQVSAYPDSGVGERSLEFGKNDPVLFNFSKTRYNMSTMIIDV
jgi:hypothetical protein